MYMHGQLTISVTENESFLEHIPCVHIVLHLHHLSCFKLPELQNAPVDDLYNCVRLCVRMNREHNLQ